MANPFSKITDTITGLWQKDSESVVGIDIGSSTIKVVQLKKRRGRAVLETYGELALGPYASVAIGQATNLPPETIVSAVKDLFKEANVTAKAAAFSVPLSSSLVALVEMPNPGERELAGMIPIEARKYIPVPVSEVTLDWWIIPKREQNISPASSEKQPVPLAPKVPSAEVLLVAIHNTMLKRMSAIAADLGATGQTFEIETFSTVRSVMGDDLAPTLILDIGAGSTKVAVVDYGIVRISHTMSKGSQDITLALSHALSISFEEAEAKKRQLGMGGEALPLASSVIDYLFFESHQVLSTYQKKYGRSVTKAVLVGGGSLLIGLAKEATARLGIPVVYGQPFEKVESPAFLAPVLSEAGPEFAGAIGLALRKLAEQS